MTQQIIVKPHLGGITSGKKMINLNQVRFFSIEREGDHHYVIAHFDENHNTDFGRFSTEKEAINRLKEIYESAC